MTTRSTRAALGLMALHLLPTAGVGQDPESLDLELVTVLTDPTGEAGIRSGVGPLRHTSGQYVMIDALSYSRLSVFDTEGEFQRHVGREGEGPGEYGQIQHLELDDLGNLHVFDLQNGRVSVLSPDFDLLRERPVTVPMASAVRFPGDTLVVTNAVLVGSAESVVVVDEKGQRVRGIGPPADPSVQKPVPLLSAAGPREVWTVHPWRYELDLYDLDGTHLRTIRRDASWLPPRSEKPPLFSPDQPPVPRVVALRRLADGDLAVLAHVAAAGWRSSIRESDGPFGGWVADDRAGVWDTFLEVIDAESGEVVASSRFSHYLTGFAADDLVHGYAEDAIGEPRIEIYGFVTSPR